MTLTKVFISYAHEDIKWLKLLREHLGWLENSGQIDAFDDRDIMVGEEWDPRIKEKLEHAEVIVLIISRHFLSSKYCTTFELRRAMQRYEDGSTHIVGILARQCDWTPLPLSKIQVLPKDGPKLKPWAKWRGDTGRDDAGAQIAKKVRGIVKKLTAKADTLTTKAPIPDPTKPQRALITIPETTWPHDLGAMPDSLLLRPESGVVPFHDYRQALVNEVLAWALTPQPPIAVRLQAGEGGAGKTRMMIEVCRLR